MTISDLLEELNSSCQSEAITMAELINDALSCDDNDTEEEKNEFCIAIATEFRDWGNYIINELKKESQ